MTAIGISDHHRAKVVAQQTRMVENNNLRALAHQGANQRTMLSGVLSWLNEEV